MDKARVRLVPTVVSPLNPHQFHDTCLILRYHLSAKSETKKRWHSPSSPFELSSSRLVRYVDDIFAVFDSVEMVSKFLQFLNNLHPNLTFTRELGDNELAFLDTKAVADPGIYFWNEFYFFISLSYDWMFHSSGSTD
jgi:hypothetical protein